MQDAGVKDGKVQLSKMGDKGCKASLGGGPQMRHLELALLNSGFSKDEGRRTYEAKNMPISAAFKELHEKQKVQLECFTTKDPQFNNELKETFRKRAIMEQYVRQVTSKKERRSGSNVNMGNTAGGNEDDDDEEEEGLESDDELFDDDEGDDDDADLELSPDTDEEDEKPQPVLAKRKRIPSKDAEEKSPGSPAAKKRKSK